MTRTSVAAGDLEDFEALRFEKMGAGAGERHSYSSWTLHLKSCLS